MASHMGRLPWEATPLVFAHRSSLRPGGLPWREMTLLTELGQNLMEERWNVLSLSRGMGMKVTWQDGHVA